MKHSVGGKRPHPASAMVVLVASGLVWTSAAGAQSVPDATQPVRADDPASPTNDGEIIVTAQRRSESIQRVPIQIDTASAAQIERAGLTKITSVALISPSLTIGSAVAVATPYIRGIGSDIATPGTEPSVALYVDGIYYTRAIVLSSGLNNIDRVEVLKGAQSSLYGRNSTGGVINVITKTPQSGTSGEFQATVGNIGRYGSTGFLNVGNDKIAANVSYNYTRRNGIYRNLVTGDRIDREDNHSIAGKILYNIDDRNKIIVGLDYNHMGPDAGTATNQLATVGNTAQAVPGVQFTTAPYKTYTDRQGYVGGVEGLRSRTNTGGVNARLISEFDAFTLNVIGSYRRLKTYQSADADSTSAPVLYFISVEENRDISADLNLVSNGNGPFSWIVGYNYFDAKIPEFRTTAFINLFGTEITSGPVSAKLDGIAHAVYGQAALRFGPDEKAKFEGGLRYTHEKRSIEGTDATFINGALVASNAVDTSKSFQNVSGSAVLSYDLTDRTMMYARYARGFKSGAFNASQILAPALKPEIVDAFEGGVKSRVGAIRLSAAGFYNIYKNLQIGQVDASGGNFVLNLPRSETYGFEAQIGGNVTESLTVDLSGTYLHARYADARNIGVTVPCVVGIPGNYPPGQCGLPPIDPTGNDMIRAPDLGASLSVGYKIPLKSGDLDFYGLARYTSSYYFDVGNALKQNSYTIVNGSVTYRDHDNWMVRAFVTNLFKANYYTFQQRITFGDFGHQGDPRMYGVTVGYSF